MDMVNFFVNPNKHDELTISVRVNTPRHGTNPEHAKAGVGIPPDSYSSHRSRLFRPERHIVLGYFAYPQFDQRGRDFRVAKVSKMARRSGFWGLRHQK